MALELEAALYIERVRRVPTKDNIADDPSRERVSHKHCSITQSV